MNPLQELSRQECVELLARNSRGRIAFTQRALPTIRAVNYALVDSHLMLREAGSEFGRCLDGQIVAFEVEDIDRWLETTWSVVLVATARLVRDASEVIRYGATSTLPAGARDGATIRLTPGEMVGHRLSSATVA